MILARCGATLTTMPNDDNSGDDIIEVSCPKCSEKVRITREKAEQDYKAKCPKGHEVPLAKAL